MTTRRRYEKKGKKYAVYDETSWYDPETRNTRKKKHYLGMAETRGGEPVRKHVTRPVMRRSDALVHLLAAVDEKRGISQTLAPSLTERELGLVRLLACFSLVSDAGLDGFRKWHKSIGEDNHVSHTLRSIKQTRKLIEEIGEKMTPVGTVPADMPRPKNTLVAVYYPVGGERRDPFPDKITDWDAFITELFTGQNEAVNHAEAIVREFPMVRTLVCEVGDENPQMWVSKTVGDNELPAISRNAFVTRLYDTEHKAHLVEEVRKSIGKRPRQPVCVVGEEGEVGSLSGVLRGESRDVTTTLVSARLLTNSPLDDEVLAQYVEKLQCFKRLSEDIWSRLAERYSENDLMMKHKLRESITYAAQLITVVAFRLQYAVIDAGEIAVLNAGSFQKSWDALRSLLGGIDRNVYRNGEVRLSQGQHHYRTLATRLGVDF